MRHIQKESDLDGQSLTIFNLRFRLEIHVLKCCLFCRKNFKVNQLVCDHHIFRWTILAEDWNENGTEHCKLREEYFLLAVKSILSIR